MSIRFDRKSLLALAVVGACGVAAGPAGRVAKAATIDWNGSTNTAWSTAANWAGGTLPANNLTTDIAEFGSVAFTNQPALSANYSVNGIVDQGTTPALVIISGAYALSVGSAGLVMNAGAGNMTISTTTLNLDAAPTSVQPNTTDTASILNASSSELYITAAWATAAVDLDIQNTGTGDIATTKANTNGIIAPWAVWGTGANTQYATVTTTAGILGGHQIGGLTTNTNTNYASVSDPNSMTSGTIDYDLSSVSTALTKSVTAYTIRYTGAAGTMSIPDGDTMTSAGYLNAGTGTLVIGQAGTTGYVAFNANKVLATYSATGDIEFAAPIKNTTTNGTSITMGGPNNLLINELDNTTTGAITVNGSGGNSASPTTGGGIYIGSSGTLNLNAISGTITMNGVIADNPTFGASSVVINSTGSATSGTVNLSGINTFTGGVTVNAGGFLNIDPYGGSTLALGTGPLNLMSGSFIGGGNGFPNGHSNPTNIYGSFTTFGNYNGYITMGSGTVTLYNSATITIGDAAIARDPRELTFNGPVVDNGNGYGITVVNDTGTAGGGLILNGSNNTFTGAPTIGVTGALTSGTTGSPTTVYTFVDRSEVGGVTTGSAVITALATTDGFVVGQTVQGSGIGYGSRILSIDSATQVTLTQIATASSAADTVYFGTDTNNVAYHGGVNGNLSLGGAANTSWTSDIILNPSGTLYIAAAGALGSGSLTVNGGLIVGAATINTSVNYLLNNDFTLGSTAGTLNFGTGPVTLGQSITITNARSGTALFGGTISDGGNGYGLTMQLATGFTSGGMTFSGPVNIGGPLTISGVATTLSAANLYTGDTIITGGTLKLAPATGINSNIAFSPKIIVGDSLADNSAALDVSSVAGVGATGFHVVSGQTLAGYGSVNGKITVDTGGHLAPGNSIGTLNVNNSVTLNGSSDFEINDDTTTSDLLTGSTKLTYGGNLNVTDLGDTNDYSVGQTFTLFTLGATGTESGAFANISLPTLPAGLTWETFGTQPFNYANGQIVVEAGSPVPEPASLMLLGLGGLALLVRRRRRD